MVGWCRFDFGEVEVSAEVSLAGGMGYERLRQCNGGMCLGKGMRCGDMGFSGME